jgi:hypothetical protein
MNIGRFDRRITHYQQGLATPDGLGGFTYGAATQTEVWCRTIQLSMGQKVNYGLDSASVTRVFEFRYFTAKDYIFQDWFVYQGNKYTINDIENINDEDQVIRIVAKKSVNE